MVTIKQISKAINAKLNDILPDVEIQSKDIREGYPRPCLYVDFEDVTASMAGAKLRERTIPVVIYYFPTDPNKVKIELLDVQEKLEVAFVGDFPIMDGFVVQIFEADAVKVDGVLQFSFDVYTLEVDDRETDNGPDMLDISIELGG
ncbi:hypothetical protein I8J29_24525 [Paenibacillus sp. MWE-103]|uniref:Minor capsid protein n=1 Tax=Paenibacillus artemisiicola TaxID=1172618 RepID=A0ABS3WGU4_9BACL|nr:hypothetical protein [Paenibacillus artemisiicola]MBO7747355.1 hypothetical protein [Paenibacillus artemisiicola]